MITLYHYWRSSASWRVRWALQLKKVPCSFVHIGLLNGENETPEHLARNPLGYVPVLHLGGSRFLSESIAMIEWLEETHPTPSLFPKNSYERALCRSLAEVINADTHPIQNLSVQYFHSDDPVERKRWAQHWIRNGLEAFEKLAAPHAGLYSIGDQVTVADLCLIPQIYNAIRFEVDLAPLPLIKAIYDRAMGTAECLASAPDKFEPAP